MSITPAPYRPDLQGLRALAISLVVLAHAGVPGIEGGFIGVDLFFVLSGYLISGLLIREYQAEGRIRLARFFARRLQRLLPALLAMLIPVMLLGSILLSAHEFHEQTASVGYAATWTSNLYFAFSEFDYFNDLHARDLFLHTWSLGVEEQFYLFWPVLLLALLAGSRSGPGPGAGRTRLVLWLLIALLASLALCIHWTGGRSTWAFYLTPTRIWQFSLGALIYLYFGPGEGNRAPSGHPVLLRALAPLGLILVLASALLLDPHTPYPGAWAMLPSLGAAMLIASGSLSDSPLVGKSLAHPLAVWIGDRSYSWYLWHWPLLMLGFAYGLDRVPVSLAALILLSLLLAAASYRWIEFPCWKGRYSGAPPGPVILAAIGGITVTAMSLGALNLDFRDQVERAEALSASARYDTPAPYAVPGCDSWYRSARLQPCTFGNPHAPRTVAFFGDSVGLQWFSFLPEIFPAEQWRILVLTKSACPVVDENYPYAAAGGAYEVCTQWRDQAIEYLAEEKPHIVFIGSAATYPFSRRQWEQGSRRILERLAPASGNIVLIPGTPQLSFNGPDCLERWLLDDSPARIDPEHACAQPLKNRRVERVSQYLNAAAAGYPNVSVLALNDLVCPRQRCTARSPDGLVVFRDRQHLTNSFVRSRAGEIRQRLERLGLR